VVRRQDRVLRAAGEPHRLYRRCLSQRIPVSLPARIGELLVSPAIIVGDLPGPRVSSVDHRIDTVHDLEGGEPSVTVVAHVHRPGPSVLEQMRSTGWRIDGP
jgi:hypothetical protein